MRRGQRGRNRWADLAPAAVLILSCLGWTLISYRFRFGQDHTERPILAFLVIWLTAWMAFAWSAFRLYSDRPFPRTGLILAVALLARIALLPSQLIQENDPYRYVLDGQVSLAGENPYEFSPNELRQQVFHPLAGKLAKPAATQVLDRISYPEIATVYPPGAQAFFVAGALLWEWDWRGQRVVFVLVDLAVLSVLLTLLRFLSIAPKWILLYAWNPLVLKEIWNSAHLDVASSLSIVLALLALVVFLERPGKAWLGAGVTGAASGLAVLTKLYPLLLLPAIGVFVWRRKGYAPAVLFGLSAIGVVLAGLWPYLDIDWPKLTGGLTTYAAHWRMNEGAFGILDLISNRPRILCAILLAGVALLVPFRSPPSVQNLLSDLGWILLLSFLLLPAPFPWYALPLLALLPLAPDSAASKTGIVLSGAASFYYLSFYFEYHGSEAHWWTLTRVLEHLVIWGSLAGFQLFRGNRH